MSTPTDFMNGGALNTRQKRVMPSRNRRGGPGIGSTDVDLMILDTQKRKLENEPLIPEDTKFLLTTNSAFVPSPSSSSSTPFELELNNHAYDRYFDRPEVLQSYKAQANIQTPEYIDMSTTPNVGSRFRPRIHEDDIADTSDAAYEKRHRKYETFEKRQRLREKEKLKHEQYKLKERMDQLRAMDGAAFLALPSSSFAPLVPDGNVEFDDLPAAHINGAAAYNEGERRRKEILDVATSLEERYRVLLPPERRHLERSERLEREKKLAAGQTPSAEPDGENGELDTEEVDPADLAAIDASNKQGEKLKFKIKFSSREPSTAPIKTTTPASSAVMPSRKRKTNGASMASPTLQMNLPLVHKTHVQAAPPSFSSSLHTFAVEPPFPATPAMHGYPPSEQSLYTQNSISDAGPPPKASRKSSKQSAAAEHSPRPRPYKRLKETAEPAPEPTIDNTTQPEDVNMAPPSNGHPNIVFVPHVTDIPPDAGPSHIEDAEHNILVPKPKRKRGRTKSRVVLDPTSSPEPGAIPIAMSISAPSHIRQYSRARSHAASPRPHLSSGSAANLEKTSCLLMVSALRTASAPLSRKTHRHVVAFGSKIPDALDEIRNFELPWFIMAPEEEAEPILQREVTQQDAGPGPEFEVEIDGAEDVGDEDEDIKDDDATIDGDEKDLANGISSLPDGESLSNTQASEEVAAAALLQL